MQRLLSSGPWLAKLAAGKLADPDAAAPMGPAERARTVEVIALAIRAKKARRTRLRWLAGGVVAAAAAVLAIAAGKHVLSPPMPADAVAYRGAEPSPEATVADVEGDLVIVREGADPAAGDSRAGRSLARGASLSPGDRVAVRGASQASFTLASGTHLRVEDAGELGVVEEGKNQIFRLGAGGLRADVAKLHPGERFVVMTHDAEVEVRGTSFRLEVVPPDAQCGGGTTTRLAVYEGVVSVRYGGAETRVGAQESWPTGCGGSDTHAATAPSGTPVRSPALPSAATAPAPGPSKSDLAAQNDLFQEAVAAKQRGDAHAAALAFERFATKYPASPLVESAMAQRMTLLGAGEAKTAAARNYLARFPFGFARADAEAILGTP